MGSLQKMLDGLKQLIRNDDKINASHQRDLNFVFVQFTPAGSHFTRGYFDSVSVYLLRGWFQQKIQI